MQELIKITIDQLVVGMNVVKFDKAGIKYTYYGKPLPDISMLNDLKLQGVTYAFVSLMPGQQFDFGHKAQIDVGTGFKPRTEYAASSAKQISTVPASEIVQQRSDVVLPPAVSDVIAAAEVHKQARDVTTQLMQDVRAGHILDTSATRNVVTSLVASCIKNPNAFVNITRLKDFDNYTFTHSVNVAVLSIALGKHLNFSDHDVKELGLAALMHDIGKMRLPERILNKPDRLNENEYKLMQKHPEYGYDYLQANQAISKDVLVAVHSHHEKFDGTGYPGRLCDNEMHKFAKIIAIADVYDAITTQRPYHKGLTPDSAVKNILSMTGKHFSAALVKFFISIMGIYPSGSLVILSTGEIAVVILPNNANYKLPKVVIVSTADRHPTTPRLIDLTLLDPATNAPYKEIVSALNPNELKLDTNKLIETFLKQAQG